MSFLAVFGQHLTTLSELSGVGIYYIGLPSSTKNLQQKLSTKAQDLTKYKIGRDQAWQDIHHGLDKQTPYALCLVCYPKGRQAFWGINYGQIGMELYITAIEGVVYIQPGVNGTNFEFGLANPDSIDRLISYLNSWAPNGSTRQIPTEENE